MPIFRETMKDLLRYDADTGLFHWLIHTHGRGGKIAPGHVAGTLKDGYVQIKVDGQLWKAHRLAWMITTGELPPKGFEIDHINGNRSDNRWVNLRQVTRSQNNHNMGVSKKNVSGTKGVSWVAERSQWLARLKVNDRVIHLGQFDRLEDAVAARKRGEQLHHGEYARKA